MSHAVQLDIVVIGMAALLEAVVQCGLDHAEAKRFGKHAVDLIVTDEQGAQVGVTVDRKTGVATFIADDARGEKVAKRVAQRWAYSKVTEELRRKGYQIAKEEKQADGTIKLTASRWK
jgi:hypothetical protein